MANLGESVVINGRPILVLSNERNLRAKGAPEHSK